jgi:K+-sensing histidine kinase KdpD
LINNLLDNANKYAPISEAIHLNLQSNHNTIQLIVKDNGMGIPVDERAKIFEKFYRVGSENTRATKGTGLGLYLCKKITDFHSANIQLSSNQPIGSIFTVTFYI